MRWKAETVSFPNQSSLEFFVVAFVQNVCANGVRSKKNQIATAPGPFIARQWDLRSIGVFFLYFATKKNSRSRRARLSIPGGANSVQIGQMEIASFEAGKTTGPKRLKWLEGPWV